MGERSSVLSVDTVGRQNKKDISAVLIVKDILEKRGNLDEIK